MFKHVQEIRGSGAAFAAAEVESYRQQRSKSSGPSQPESASQHTPKGHSSTELLPREAPHSFPQSCSAEGFTTERPELLAAPGPNERQITSSLCPRASVLTSEFRQLRAMAKGLRSRISTLQPKGWGCSDSIFQTPTPATPGLQVQKRETQAKKSQHQSRSEVQSPGTRPLLGLCPGCCFCSLPCVCNRLTNGFTAKE